MGKKSKETVPKKGTNVFFGSVIAAVAIVGVYLAMQQPGSSVGVSDTITAKPAASTTPRATKDDKVTNPIEKRAEVKKDALLSASDIPTYEEYVAKSLENKWAPADPVEKLEATIAKYGQVLKLLACYWFTFD
jgi:hypothetical protein